MGLREQYQEVATKFNKLSSSSPLYPVKNTFDVEESGTVGHQGGNRRVNERQQIINEEISVDFGIENISTSQNKLAENDR